MGNFPYDRGQHIVIKNDKCWGSEEPTD